MTKLNEWIAGLPAPVRHGLAIFVGTLGLAMIVAIQAHGGVVGLDWSAALLGGVDEAAVAAVGALVVLFSTPLTDAYGFGKHEAAKQEVEPGVSQTAVPPTEDPVDHEEYITDYEIEAPDETVLELGEEK